MEFKSLKMLKNNRILNYLIRLFCFLVTVKCGFFYIGSLIFIIFYPVIWVLVAFFVPLAVKLQEKYAFFNIYSIENFRDNIADIIIIYFTAFIALYVLAKIFGIFKKLDKLNFFISLFIIVLISFLLITIGKINSFVPQDIYENGLKYACTMYLLIPAFFLYKFFNFLTKKFPTPFKQIGYFFSIEFYKDMFKNFKNKLKKNDVNN